MKLKQIIIGVLLAIVAFLGGDYTANTLGGAYEESAIATTTESFGTGGAYKEQLLKSTNGVFVGVNVTLTSNANLFICNATTTGSQFGVAFSTTTQCFATFKTTTVGSYPYNVAFDRGLIAISNTTVGMASSSLMYR